MEHYPRMDYCMQCGTKLNMSYNEEEGKEIPFCPQCGEFRFPVFSAGVVMVILDPEHENLLMIRQFLDERWYLVAGYIDKGENAEQCVAREAMEEVGLEVTDIHCFGSGYYAPSNTLLFYYSVTAKNTQVRNNFEVDEYKWFNIQQAVSSLPKHDLASTILKMYTEE